MLPRRRCPDEADGSEDDGTTVCRRLRPCSKVESAADDARTAEVLALTGILLGVWEGVGGLGALGALKEANEAADADCRGLRELASDIRLPGRPAARLAGRRGAALEVVGVEKLLAELMRRSVTGICWVR
jgi:hypothetical protein